MNDNESTPAVPPMLSSYPAESDLRHYAKRFLLCNPFYLISAACLLYGLYRLTIEPSLRDADLSQLSAIFGSLQLYELLLVVTAIFLAWRGIWYDSTLLVFLENMLVFVPFILVTVAAFFQNSVIWTICGTGALFAIARFWGLKQFIRELNLPSRLLAIGLVILAANLVVPFFFKSTLVNAVESLANHGRWGWFIAVQTSHIRDLTPLAVDSQWGWFIVLPALLGLTNLLARPTQWGGGAAQRSWLPLAFAAIWVAASAMHLYCLGYVYDLAWEPALLTPLLWMAAWTFHNRRADFADILPQGWQTQTEILPAVTILLAVFGGLTPIVFALSLLNVVIYGATYFRHRNNGYASRLMFLSLATVAASMPLPSHPVFGYVLTRPLCIQGAIVLYMIGNSLFSRASVWGIIGAVAVFLVTIRLSNHDRQAMTYATQAALFYVLLHSLRWERELPADMVRGGLAMIWLVHSTTWVFHSHMHHSGLTAVAAVTVLAGYALYRVVMGRWVSFVVPIVACLMLFLIPVHWLLTAATVGILAVLGAFALFGLGTFVAVAKEKWLQPANHP